MIECAPLISRIDDSTLRLQPTAAKTQHVAVGMHHRHWSCSHVFHRPHLALSVELRPVYPVQIHELARDRASVLVRSGLDDGIAADDFLGLGERTVGDRQLAAARPYSKPRRARLQ